VLSSLLLSFRGAWCMLPQLPTDAVMSVAFDPAAVGRKPGDWQQKGMEHAYNKLFDVSIAIEGAGQPSGQIETVHHNDTGILRAVQSTHEAVCTLVHGSYLAQSRNVQVWA
jgi:hypothetical protein